MRAAAAPRKPKKGAVSSPLNADDIFLLLTLLLPLPLELRRETEAWGLGPGELSCRGLLLVVVAGTSARDFAPLLGIWASAELGGGVGWSMREKAFSESPIHSGY